MQSCISQYFFEEFAVDQISKFLKLECEAEQNAYFDFSQLVLIECFSTKHLRLKIEQERQECIILYALDYRSLPY